MINVNIPLAKAMRNYTRQKATSKMSKSSNFTSSKAWKQKWEF